MYQCERTLFCPLYINKEKVSPEYITNTRSESPPEKYIIESLHLIHQIISKMRSCVPN
jgi:hypothetical protein